MGRRAAQRHFRLRHLALPSVSAFRFRLSTHTGHNDPNLVLGEVYRTITRPWDRPQALRHAPTCPLGRPHTTRASAIPHTTHRTRTHGCSHPVGTPHHASKSRAARPHASPRHPLATRRTLSEAPWRVGDDCAQNACPTPPTTSAPTTDRCMLSRTRDACAHAKRARSRHSPRAPARARKPPSS